MMANFKIINRDHQKEDFNEEKLYNSAYYPALEAELDQERANEIAEKVVWEVKAWMSDHEDSIFSTTELRERVRTIMKREDEDSELMYHTHMDLN